MSERESNNFKSNNTYTYSYRISDIPIFDTQPLFLSNPDGRKMMTRHSQSVHNSAKNSVFRKFFKISNLKDTKFVGVLDEHIELASLRISGIKIPYFAIWIGACFFIATIAISSSLALYNSNALKFALPSTSLISSKIFTDISNMAILADDTSLVKSDLDHSFSQVELQTYELQEGDFLSVIAEKNNLSIDTIVSWNNIKDARRVRAGDEIILPNKSGVLHTVQKNETLSSIAQRYNVSAVNILDANNLKSQVAILGTKLFIPNAKMNEFELGLVLGTIFLAPARGYITSRYGYRTSPITNTWHFHGAVDIAGKKGSPILAATYGVVTYVSQNNPNYGKIVIIRHPGGFQTLYAHMDKIYVTQGQSVSRGRTIGTMGSTGESTGTHLHFAVIHNGKSVNPLIYIRL